VRQDGAGGGCPRRCKTNPQGAKIETMNLKAVKSVETRRVKLSSFAISQIAGMLANGLRINSQTL
jgi:hypothetical protein